MVRDPFSVLLEVAFPLALMLRDTVGTAARILPFVGAAWCPTAVVLRGSFARCSGFWGVLVVCGVGFGTLWWSLLRF